MSDIRKQRVMQEIEEKGQTISLNWFYHNYERVFRNPEINPEEIPKRAHQLYKEIVELRRQMLKEERQILVEENLKRRPSPMPKPPPAFCPEDLARGPMRPVSPEIKKLLYVGVSKSDGGRKAYLDARYRSPPESKYYNPPSFGLEYGWKVSERAWPVKKDFVRKSLILTSFYRRTGALKVVKKRARLPFSTAHVAVEIL